MSLVAVVLAAGSRVLGAVPTLEPSPETASATPEPAAAEGGKVLLGKLDNGLGFRLEPTPGGAEVAVCMAVRRDDRAALESGPDLETALARQLALGATRGQVRPEELLRVRGGKATVILNPHATVYCSSWPARELPLALWLAQSRFQPLRVAHDSEVAPMESEATDAAEAPKLLESKLRKLVFLGQYQAERNSDAPLPSPEELAAFHRDTYVAQNTSLAISGGFEPEEARGLIQTYLGRVPGGERVQAPKNEVRPQSSERFSIVFDSGYRAPAVAYGWALPEGRMAEPTRLALSILASDGRLGKKLRARGGPAQELSVHVDAAGPSALGTIFALGRYATSSELIENEVDRALLELTRVAPNPEEIERADTELKAARARDLESPLGRAELLAMGELLSAAQVDSLAEPDVSSNAAHFDPEQIRLAASQFLSHRRRSVVEFYPRGWKDPWETPMPTYHIVNSGESLIGIAKAHSTNLATLLKLNKLNPKSPIFPGDRLRVPRGKPKLKLKSHTVKKGDTLSQLAERYGVNAKAIAEQNGLGPKHRLAIGQILEIPGAAAKGSSDSGSKTAPDSKTAPEQEGRTHVVAPGETLIGIARKFGVTPEELARENGLGSRALVRVGQKVRVPLAPPPPTKTPSAKAPPNKTSGVQNAQVRESLPQFSTYTVKKGDTLSGIAHKHSIGVEDLIRQNHLARNKPLRPGQKLSIPVP